MSNDIEKKRYFVSNISPRAGWKQKVRKMSDAQIVAIYLREISKPKKDPKPSQESGADGIPF